MNCAGNHYEVVPFFSVKAPRTKAYARKRSTQVLGLAYPANKNKKKRARGCKHPSHFSFYFCLTALENNVIMENALLW